MHVRDTKHASSDKRTFQNRIYELWVVWLRCMNLSVTLNTQLAQRWKLMVMAAIPDSSAATPPVGWGSSRTGNDGVLRGFSWFTPPKESVSLIKSLKCKYAQNQWIFASNFSGYTFLHGSF